jgi:DNA-binding NarL/FixJ family response regulator
MYFPLSKRILWTCLSSRPTKPVTRWSSNFAGMLVSLLSVLIVDDSVMIRRCLRYIIEENQALYISGEAENGEVAIQKVRDLRPDVVILDFQMPVMNGLEAARQIRIFAPDTVILMYTGHRSDQLLKEAKAAGVREVFSKTDGESNHLRAWLSSAVIAL